jgi:DNA-binding transcriptional LysR family regulator
MALIQRHGTLAGAAAQLGLTPAAVTQQVSRAERDWGTRLVNRGPRGASLTPAGTLLARHGEVIAAQTDHADAAFAALRGQLSLRLRIGTFQAAALHLLPPALTALRHRHPDADLSIVDIPSDRGVQAVEIGQLDLAIIAGYDRLPAPVDSVRLHEVMTDPLVLVLPDDHPLAGPPARPLHLRQLADEAWVLIRAGHVARAQFDRAAATAGITPRVRFETESYDVAQALVGTGIGVALISRLALADVPGTTHRALTRPGLQRRIYAAALADPTLTPLVDVFLGLLDDVAGDITSAWNRLPPPPGAASSP